MASITRLCPAASALCMARPISFLVATGTPMFGVLPMRPRTHSAAPATAARESMAPRDGGCGCRLSKSSTVFTSSPANATAIRFDHAVWFLGFVTPTKALPPCAGRVIPSRTGLCGGGSAPYPPCSAQLAQKNAESGIWSTHPECCQTPHRALQHRIMSSLPSSSTHPHSQWTHSNVASVNPGARLTPSISPGCGSASVPPSSSSSSSSSKKATFSSSNTMKSTPSSSSSSSPRSISASSSARSISCSSASSRPIFSFSSETCSFQISDLRARPTLMRELVRFSPRSALSDVGVLLLLLSTAGLSIGGASSSSLLSRMARGLCPGLTRRLGAGDAPPFSFPREPGASSSDSFSSPSSAPPPCPRLFLSFLSRSRLDLADVGSATAIGWTATGDGGSTSSEEDVSFDADADAFLFLSSSSSSSLISMASSEVFPAPSPPPPSSSSTSSPPPPPSSSTSSSSHTKSSMSLEKSSSSLTRSALTPATFTFGRYS